MNTPNRRTGDVVIAILALIQTGFGVLRALEWLHTGSDLLGKGLLILPLLGMAAYMRSALIIGIVLLYLVFALGVFMRRGWARSFGIAAAVVNLLLVLSVVAQGDALLRALIWAIVPVIILWQLFGRRRSGPIG